MSKTCIRPIVLPLLLGSLFIGTSCSAPSHSPPERVWIESDARRAYLTVGGGQIEVILPDQELAVSDEALVQWIHNAADSVTNYFGHYPVKQVTITLSAHGWHGVSDGWTSRAGIHVALSPRVQQRQLDRDWVMTHEMFHLAFPEIDDQYNWLSEGLATYLEPIARARLGFVTPEKVWKDMIEGCPKGQPRSNDEGLNNTHSWGRTYWGGATFCLVADVQIRQRTHNRKSLDDAMRAILDAGGNRYESWTIQRVLTVGDRATGTNVLHELFAQMAEKPLTVDLDALWKQLGVEYDNGKVQFDNTAPLAAIRESMTRGVLVSRSKAQITNPHYRQEN